jgi:hypothetical protein
VPQARVGRLQIGITVAMKPEQEKRPFSESTKAAIGALPPPEIVGEVADPRIETVHRLWWRAFDRACYWVVLMRLSIHDRIYGPEQPAEFKREVDHDGLVPLGSPYYSADPLPSLPVASGGHRLFLFPVPCREVRSEVC